MITSFFNRNKFNYLYGERTTSIARRLETLLIKRNKIEEHIKFLRICKQKNTIPKGFIIKKRTNFPKNRKILEHAMIKLRNNTMSQKYKQLRLINIEIKTQKNIVNIYMKNINPQRNYKKDLTWVYKEETQTRKKIATTHQKKLKTLKEIQDNSKCITKNTSKNADNDNNNDMNERETNVINLSKKTLNKHQIKLLEKG